MTPCGAKDGLVPSGVFDQTSSIFHFFSEQLGNNISSNLKIILAVGKLMKGLMEHSYLILTPQRLLWNIPIIPKNNK